MRTHTFFFSCHKNINGDLAQLAEYVVRNDKAPGSNPGFTNKKKKKKKKKTDVRTNGLVV